MTRSFFRQLTAHKVRYLLISGQATVLYGAATFSEDLDIWLSTSARNVRRFLTALRKLRARYYKLTPPLTPTYLRKGHGFHFVLPDNRGAPWYLDVMGVPPRVPGFATAWRRSTLMQTPWGAVPVVGLPDLIKLKKTRRMEDYAVIGRLVLELMRVSALRPNRRLARWAMQNIFSLPLLTELIQRQPWVVTVAGRGLADLRTFGSRLMKGKKPGQMLERRIERDMMRRMTACQAADRLYWRPIIAELRNLHSRGLLIPEGVRV